MTLFGKVISCFALRQIRIKNNYGHSMYGYKAVVSPAFSGWLVYTQLSFASDIDSECCLFKITNVYAFTSIIANIPELKELSVLYIHV